MNDTQFDINEIANLLGHKDLIIFDLSRKLDGALAEVKRLTIQYEGEKDGKADVRSFPGVSSQSDPGIVPR